MFEKKINLENELKKGINKMRGGWWYPIQSLKSLHNDCGTLVEGFCIKFVNAPDTCHKEPWIGFFHQPHNIPKWHPLYSVSPQNIFETEGWKKSIEFCKGLFVMCHENKVWLENQLDIPIISVVHPTPEPDIKFSLSNYINNKDKKIIHIGWWLRKLHSIYHLPVKNLKKKNVRVYTERKQEIIEFHKKKYGFKNERLVQGLTVSNNEYDELLSENIVFLDLWASTTNNTILECIIRNTPILVNPLPAVIEHLGKDYPFYFNNLEEAAAKAEDLDCISKTYEHLKRNPIKEKLNGKYFCKSVAESEIYKGL